MKSQFDFYLRLLPTAEARTRTYWGHAGACFTEQMENFGLPNPAEYGFKRPESYDRGVGNIMHGWNTNGIRFLNFVR